MNPIVLTNLGKLTYCKLFGSLRLVLLGTGQQGCAKLTTMRPCLPCRLRSRVSTQFRATTSRSRSNSQGFKTASRAPLAWAATRFDTTALIATTGIEVPNRARCWRTPSPSTRGKFMSRITRAIGADSPPRPRISIASAPSRASMTVYAVVLMYQRQTQGRFRFQGMFA